MNRIKALRQGAGMKQSELAELINVSQAALSGYETGKFQADVSTYIAIAKVFNTTVDDVLGADEQKEPATPKDDGLSDLDRELISLLRQLSPDDRRRVGDFAAGLKSARAE